MQTVARYADKDLLLSGWLEGGDVIAGRAAVVQAAVGAGRVVLLGFRVQHRGQSLATFRLLFNALLSGRHVARPLPPPTRPLARARTRCATSRSFAGSPARFMTRVIASRARLLFAGDGRGAAAGWTRRPEP